MHVDVYPFYRSPSRVQEREIYIFPWLQVRITGSHVKEAAGDSRGMGLERGIV
jgi:hypothetical protein